jgi:hypothetical protein
VKLPLDEKAADELCVFTVVLDTEADTVTDLLIGPVAD